MIFFLIINILSYNLWYVLITISYDSYFNYKSSWSRDTHQSWYVVVKTKKDIMNHQKDILLYSLDISILPRYSCNHTSKMFVRSMFLISSSLFWITLPYVRPSLTTKLLVCSFISIFRFHLVDTLISYHLLIADILLISSLHFFSLISIFHIIDTFSSTLLFFWVSHDVNLFDLTSIDPEL